MQEGVIIIARIKVMKKTEVEKLLDHIVNDMGIFSSDYPFDIWKSAFESMTVLKNFMRYEMDHWKVDDDLQEFKNLIDEYTKILEKEGLKGVMWRGRCDECGEIMHEFRRKSIPLLMKIATQLDPTSEIRKQVVDKLQKFHLVHNA